MKHIIASALLLGLMTHSKAQNLSLGPISGFNHTWLTGTQSNRVFNPGGTIGGRLTYSFTPSWGVGTDLLFSLEGVRTKTETSIATTTRDANMHYLRLNPRMIYFFGDLGDRLRPNIYAGTTFGALIGGNTITTVNGYSEGPSVETKTKTSEIYNGFDAGLFAGAGLNYRIGKAIWLNTEATYSNGLVDLTKSDNSWSASRGVAFNVGVTFPIGTVKSK